MIDSRSKGKRGEREVGHILTEAGLSFIREQDGRTQGADYLVEQYICAEARFRKQLRIIPWSQEIEAKTPEHLVPVLAYRPNGEPWRASMLLTDWAAMVKAGT